MSQQILMNYTTSPTEDDLKIIADQHLDNLPDELVDLYKELTIRIEEFPDEATQSDLDFEDPFELLALYKAGKELSPGVEKKVANDDDVLILYRRPILDIWCETGEDLSQIIREAMIEEIANHFEFSDSDIEEMTQRHYQGML